MNRLGGRTFGLLSVSVVIIGFLLVSSGMATAQQVTYPTSTGVTWHRCEHQTISWTGVSGQYVKIDLYRGNRRDRTLTHFTPNTGSFAWRVPHNQKISSNYRIKITGTSRPHDYDYSDNYFTIIPPTATVDSPNGGEVYYRGSSYNIQWHTSTTGGSVRIDLFKGSRKKVMITNTTSNTGSYSWLIPPGMRPGNDYRIKVTSTSNRQQFDFSDAYFTIVEPGIRVTYPNDSHITWHKGGYYTITWTNSGEPGTSVRIDLYKGSTRKHCVTNSTLNTGGFAWAVSRDVRCGNDYRIKVTSVNQPKYYDYSDHYFSITEGVTDAYVDIVDPAGDPTSPDPGICGNCEVVFSSDAPVGVLTVICRFRVVAGSVTDISGKVRACISDLGTSNLEWQDQTGAASNWSGSPNGQPAGANSTMGHAVYDTLTGLFEARAVYTGLPDNNGDFGLKRIWAQIVDDGTVVAQDLQPIEVFYPRDAINNPAYPVGDSNWGPNWFYYWKTGNVCGITAGWEWEPMSSYGYYGLGEDHVNVGDPASWGDPYSPFVLHHKYTGQPIVLGAAGLGPHMCAIVIAHELLHKQYYDDWNALIIAAEADGDVWDDYYDDADDDGIPNGEEPTAEGINTYPDDPDTYDMDSYSPGYALYGDQEIRCRRREQNHTLVVTDADDWASPGTNTVPPFVYP